MSEANGDLDAETRRELERVALEPATSGRAAMAKVTALRTLERVSRGRNAIPPCPEGWHPGPPAMVELDRVFLDEHSEVRERWWLELTKRGRM